MGNIIIRLNCGKRIGMGHLIRMLSLAEEFPADKVVFLINNDPGTKSKILQAGYKCEQINSNPSTYEMQEDAPDYLNGEIPHLRPILDRYQPAGIILDVVNTTIRYIDFLKIYTEKIVCFDNISQSREKIDTVINALWHKKEDFQRKNIHVGHKYLLLRKNIHKSPIKIKSLPRNILVSFGGSDTNDLTIKILRQLETFFSTCSFHILIGKTNTSKTKIEQYARENGLTTYYDAKDVAAIMDKADIAITSGGITLYELLSKGIPSIVIRQHPNEIAYSTLPPDCYIDCGVFSDELNIKDSMDTLYSRIDLRKQLQMAALDNMGATNRIKLIDIIKRGLYAS